jgi:hypothetical protein
MRLRLLALTVVAAACGGDASRSPACGLAVIASPALIEQQFHNARVVITDPPRGLTDSLPAMVIQQKQAFVRVGYDAAGKSIVMEYVGEGFPTHGGYGLLVVDDTSHRAVGVLIYERVEPKDYPHLGTITSGAATLTLYGVRVDWASVSNPVCPLLGAPPPATQPAA